jgi:hypothetical protein
MAEASTAVAVGTRDQSPEARQGMQELRDEFHRPRPAWEVELVDLDGVLAYGHLTAPVEHAYRHQLVAHELLRRLSHG